MRSVFALIASIGILKACTDGSSAAPDPSLTLDEGAAQMTTCSGVLASATYQNVRVPAGSTCTLQGVTVNGNVIALEGSRLVLENATVKGNVQGERAAMVHVTGGTFGGNIQIQDGSSPGELGVSISGGTRLSQGSIQVSKMQTGQIRIADAIIEKGNLQVEENAVSGVIEILRNRVAQNLEFRKHQTSATKVVSDNTVGQKLECNENATPFAASSNSAGDLACR